MSMFNDTSCYNKGNEEECLANAKVVSILAKKFGIGQWILRKRIVHKELGITSRTKCCWNSQKADILSSVQQLHCPGVSSRAKGVENCPYTSAADQDTIDTIYRIILSVNQLSVYGAVAAICEEFEDHQNRSGEPEILMGQSIVLGEVKAGTPLQNESPMNDQIIWQQYIQQVESLSLENRVSKFCKEAGFMRVVEVGQFLVTRDTGDFRQFQTVACREYTLPRDDRASQPKGWIQGNMRIGPVLDVTTSFQHFKYGIEIRLESVNKDSSHSWARISYGTVKYVIDSSEDNTEIPADQPEEQVPQTSTNVAAARSKAKSKPQPRVLVGTTATIPIHERRWIDIEPSKQNLASYDISKKVINLLRHNQTLQREEGGAIEFYRIKFYLRSHQSQIHNWSDDVSGVT